MKCHLLGTGGSVNGLHRHNTSLFFESPEGARQSVLIDCNGVCVQRLTAAGIAFEDIEHVFLTHEHIDHIGALINLIHQVWAKGCLYRSADNRRTRPLNIYANAPTMEVAQKLIDAVKLPLHPYMFEYRFHELDAHDGGTIDTGSVRLQYYPVNHGPTLCSGVYVDGSYKRLVFSSDTEPFPAIYSHLRPGDVLVHDCNKIDQDVSPGHCTWAQIEAFLPDLPAGVTTCLVHLPAMDTAAEDAFRQSIYEKYGDRVAAGTDGLVIEF